MKDCMFYAQILTASERRVEPEKVLVISITQYVRISVFSALDSLLYS
jgi:hypothetical protein